MMELKMDLHIHTNFSDGRMSPEQAIDRAKEMGLDAIAITDHDNIEGNLSAQKYAKKKNIILIPALEITTVRGDILALGVESFISGEDPMVAIEAVHALGGIAVLAHPFAVLHHGVFVDNLKDVEKFDAIEVFNAMTPIDANAMALKLAKHLNMPAIAGSDAHSYEEVGKALTSVAVKNKSVKGILEGIRAGKTKILWV